MRTVLLECDTFATPKAFRTKRRAILWFLRTATDLARIGQTFSATLHYGSKDDFSDCPDCILTLGPRGGVKVEKA